MNVVGAISKGHPYNVCLFVFQVHSRGKALAKDVDFEKISRRTPGFTGADLQNLMNEAAILAARRDLKEISKDEISDALERIIAGPEKKNAVVSEEKKKLVAYHGMEKRSFSFSIIVFSRFLYCLLIIKCVRNLNFQRLDMLWLVHLCLSMILLLKYRSFLVDKLVV